VTRGGGNAGASRAFSKWKAAPRRRSVLENGTMTMTSVLAALAAALAGSWAIFRGAGAPEPRRARVRPSAHRGPDRA
jgi:hypothetical protein